MTIHINSTIYAKIILNRVIALSYGSKSLISKNKLIKFKKLIKLAEYEFLNGYLKNYSVSINSNKKFQFNKLKRLN